MNHQPFRLAFPVPFLLLCARPRTRLAQAAPAYAVLAWGYNEHDQPAVPVAAQSGVKAVKGGWAHTVALKNDGSVVECGLIGQRTVATAALSGLTAIAAGEAYTVVLKDDGSVLAWGSNS